MKARDVAIERALRAASGEGLSFLELLGQLPEESWLGEEQKRRALSDALTRCRLKKRAAPGVDQRWRWQAA